ncbi:DUF2975 domain-containing protein [Streptomyces sp. M2CJ-2]|nr:DUF2975 domain-containing protein [Streptomyces sp. M2CJ-2]
MIVVLGVVTAQLVPVCVWRLVTMARRGAVFSHAAFRYVHLGIGAFVAAALLAQAVARDVEATRMRAEPAEVI